MKREMAREWDSTRIIDGSYLVEKRLVPLLIMVQASSMDLANFRPKGRISPLSLRLNWVWNIPLRVKIRCA
jgi:hypothetical protein